MNYIIVKKFGPGSNDWTRYAEWAGITNCREYCSIDGINRPSLFSPSSKEDWANCVNEDYKIHLITNLAYALKIKPLYPDGEIVGVIEDPRLVSEEITAAHYLVGYDILDGYNSVSLLTNWGGEKLRIVNLKLNEYALLTGIDEAYEFKSRAREEYPQDPHSLNCEVWAVYKIK